MSAFEECTGLVEVINLSPLHIEAGSYDHGSVAAYALEVHGGDSRLVTADDYLFYTTADGNNHLVGYIGTATNLTLPNNYQSQSYRIHRAAFCGRPDLVSITIPSGVTEIGEYAFYNCSGLTSVTISEGVTHIGFGAFSWCSSLTSITLPGSLHYIEGNAFEECYNLETIHFCGSNPQWIALAWERIELNSSVTVYCNGEELVPPPFIHDYNSAHSYDTFYVNDEMYFEWDGNADAKLALQDNTVHLTKDHDYSIALRGWIGFNQPIVGFGYFIDTYEFTYDDEFIDETEEAVLAAGGPYASRFRITVPVDHLDVGSHQIGFVLELQDGTVVLLHAELTIVISE